MSFWILLQVLVNVVLAAGVVGLWIKLNRPAKDDPRMSRGLQLLQTKISILEDLSDRTDTQVTQLTALMEHKVKEIQAQVLLADKQVQKVETSIMKSLEVARIFQDRIPHQEIVDRQNTIKYVKAARLAHQGLSADEIAQQVDLSKGEIDFITKVNRDHLQFSEEDLPEWANENLQQDVAVAEYTHPAAPTNQDLANPSQTNLSPQILVKTEDRMTLSELGDRFRKAIPAAPAAASMPAPALAAEIVRAAPMPSTPAPAPTVFEEAQNSRGETVQIKRVIFPKVDSDNRS